MKDKNVHTGDHEFISFKRGEESGFAYFFNLYYKPLIYYSKQFLKDDALAEDVVEDCFIKLWNRRTEIQSADTIKGFLYVMVRNACLDQIEKIKTRETHHKHFIYQSEDSDSNLDINLVRTETIHQVLLALEELPPASRKVFKLFYFENKSYAEIAAELGLSENTIRNQKARGLFLLKKRFLPIVLSFFYISL